MKVRSNISAGDLERLMQKVEPRYWEGVRPFFWIEMSDLLGSPCMAVYFDQGDLWYLIIRGPSQAGDLTWMNGAEAISLFIREAESNPAL